MAYEATAHGVAKMAMSVTNSAPRKPSSAAAVSMMAGATMRRAIVLAQRSRRLSAMPPFSNDAPRIISATGVVAAPTCAIGFRIGSGIGNGSRRQSAPRMMPSIIGFLSTRMRIGTSWNLPPRNISSSKTAKML